ncbi:Uncharacterized Fe-S cluster protein YjdI [Deinococcus reticulitermitis]|uniref:Uncharacterized Fe-S cluster protein YjdI n=1 Tax=Deinococcus reticulitermitis TaxID=856736 RepID=A0A1H6VIB6_9DEIO|nr:(4Fe-4S)-binding protein [Deinococcus reticulitermitis]SEJ00082.1 Uncharacterized Fe-S cluster protein YjdI [Deinococcus reticulitermitis]
MTEPQPEPASTHEIAPSEVPAHWGRAYTAPEITVYYDRGRCIHYAACVRGLPEVFDTAKKPWIQPAQAQADAVAEVVRRCPTGALHYVYAAHGGPPELPEPATVEVRENGPLFLRGDLTLHAPDTASPGGPVHDTRAALCRCGQSGNKPFCDGSHRQAGFVAPGGAKINTA